VVFHSKYEQNSTNENNYDEEPIGHSFSVLRSYFYLEAPTIFMLFRLVPF
jgi:hypothetical protein